MDDLQRKNPVSCRVRDDTPSPPPSRRSASDEGQSEGGSGAMQAFDPFDSFKDEPPFESFEDNEPGAAAPRLARAAGSGSDAGAQTPNGGPGDAYFFSPPSPPPPHPLHGDQPPPPLHPSWRAPFRSSAAQQALHDQPRPQQAAPPLALERSSSHAESILSFESARENTRKEDQLVMTPGEAEDLAELRGLLPLFRSMRGDQRRGGGDSNGNSSNGECSKGLPPRSPSQAGRGSVLKRAERAASPPPLLPPFRDGGGLNSDGGDDPEAEHCNRPPSDLLAPADGTCENDFGCSREEECMREIPPELRSARSSSPLSKARKRCRRNQQPRSNSSSMMGHISPGMDVGVWHGVYTARAGNGTQGGTAQDMNMESGATVDVRDHGSDDSSDEGRSDDDSDDDDARSRRSSSAPTVNKLSRDVYSLLYFTKPLSACFFFAVGVFAFQLLILALIMADIVDISNETNPLNIPSGVSTVVRTSQCLAVLIAVATQDDLITSINAFHAGYDGGIVERKGVGGYQWQWLLSVFCRFAEGGLCLAVTFVLIMASDDVVGLFLDFLAVTFVSTLDDIAFALARDGYFSKRLRRETGEILRVRIPNSRRVGNHFFRPLVFLIVSAGMLAGWGVVSTKQKIGSYLSCDRIAVQMSDEFRASLAFFSSIYDVSAFDFRGRPIYREVGPLSGQSEHFGNAQFAYCESENAWTFSYADSEGEEIDPCHWYAKSAETDAWDIMAISPSEWFVYGKESKGAVPFQHFSLKCIDCDDSERGECSMVGTCANNVCICNDGRYGLNCEFEEPFNNLAIDTSTASFPGPEEWSNKFTILYADEDNETQAKVYERPVYTREVGNGTHHVIMFTGRRWILANSKKLIDYDPNATDTSITPAVTTHQLAAYLSLNFHAHWTPYHADFMSSPADVVTPSDAATPVGLDWYRTKSYEKGADENFPIQTQLLCTTCDEPLRNPCGNGGTCGADGKCACKYGTFGALCQIKDFILCRSVAVQFGDELISFLPAFSGVYDLVDNYTVSERSVYVARRLGGAMFAYCESEMAWTFSLLPPGERSLDEADPCHDWRAMSKETETYNIASLTDGWTVRRNQKTDEGVPLVFFQLECVDCSRTTQLKAKKPCSSAGQCDEDANTCVCDEGNYGITCQLFGPCSVLEVDSSRQVKWPSRYSLLRHSDGADVKVYERPVYVSDMAESTFYTIIFIGRRWIITRSETHARLGSGGGTTRAELARYLSDEFHGYYSNYTVEFISESIQINTNMDTASPVDLNWYEPKQFDNKRPDFQLPLERSPNCAFCNNLDYPCYNKGVCTDGKCACRYGTFGNLCQIDTACISLAVEFGSSLSPPLPSLSGDYNLKGGPNNTYSDRPVYLLPTGRAMLAYCERDRRWTFTHWLDEQNLNPPGPCGNWTARSGATYTYDITATTKWQRRKNATSVVTLLPASFSYACNDERRRTEQQEDKLSGGGVINEESLFP